ncbi:MAG: D-alanyl-D-alanine carboxypeptidase [Hyphomicrobiales bacterium]|nr:D-alanyl-D-alanine carboxypeptidase [Hyphomicrobiales bacterium]
MPLGRSSIGRRVLFGFAVTFMLGAVSAQATTPYLVVDADSDQVLMENEATAPWYPASLTKLMTVYLALEAVRNGKLTLDTPLIMSARAARMPPSKMGFRPGTEVTLDNALKMLMVKSPNDVAVMVAEGVSGSIEAFADDMNADAQRLGMQESHFVNPNGLHNPNHVSSARDMAIVARALLHEFPDHADLFNIGALQLGRQYIPNHNGLLGRYPGADGMKTGFTCPAGFNVVASANHSGRRLIVVVLGAPTARTRNQEAADLFDRGFAMGGGAGSLESLPSVSGAPDPHSNVCLHRNAALLAAAAEEDSIAEQAQAPAGPPGMLPTPLAALFASVPHTQLPDGRIRFDPVPVYIGPAPGWKGPALGARPTATETAAAPIGAKTISAESAPTAATPSEGDASAPVQSSSKPKLKVARHLEKRMAHKPVKSATEKSEKKDVSTD